MKNIFGVLALICGLIIPFHYNVFLMVFGLGFAGAAIVLALLPEQ